MKFRKYVNLLNYNHLQNHFSFCVSLNYFRHFATKVAKFLRLSKKRNEFILFCY